MGPSYDNDDLFFANMISKAEALSLLSILEEVCQQIGLRDPDGLPLVDRFYTQRKVELERLFRSLENGNPALAARLFDRYEDARKSLGEERS